MTKQTATDSIWTGTVKGLPSGAYATIQLLATDSSIAKNKDSVSVRIKYDPGKVDLDGPVIKQISGPQSGTSVPNAAIQIIDSIVDPNQVDSVYWTKNNGVKKVMPLVTGTNNQYTLNDTLSEGKFDTLVVTAVDKSSNQNRSTQTIVLKYIKIKTYSLAITTNNGSVTQSPYLTSYDSGTVVTLTPVPFSGYHFTEWSGALTGSTNPGTITMNESKSITAGFAINPPNSFTLTILADNGTVTKTPDHQQYDSNSNVGLKAKANTGYHFVNWSGDATGATDSTTIVMTTSRNVTANFAINTYQLTVTADTGGSVTPATTPVTVNYGAATTITATAANGYNFANWTVTSGTASIASTSSASTTVTLTSGDATVTANFAENRPTASATQNTPQTSCAPANRDFTAYATGGTPPYTYEWYYSPLNNPVGITTQTMPFSIAPSATDSTYTFYCVVTDVYGMKGQTNNVSITVYGEPNITGPSDLSICESIGSGSMHVDASDATHWQWYNNNDEPLTDSTYYSGTKSATLNFNSIPSSWDGYKFYCVVTNSHECIAYSTPATLTVNPMPTSNNIWNSSWVGHQGIGNNPNNSFWVEVDPPVGTTEFIQITNTAEPQYNGIHSFTGQNLQEVCSADYGIAAAAGKISVEYWAINNSTGCESTHSTWTNPSW